MFMGVIAGKHSRDFTHLLGMPRGLKGLLYMLNAIVSPMIEDLCFLFLMCFSFDSGLRFLVFNVFFIFVLLGDKQNVSLKIFDECQI
jgi:hypothetical protein